MEHLDELTVVRGSLDSFCPESRFNSFKGEKTMAKSSMTKLGELLVLIGGIVGIIYGIAAVLSFPLFDPIGWELGGILGGIISGIILIVVSLVTLATSGVINIPALKLGKSWIVLLILGILIYIFGSGLGGILVIIGAILLAL